MTIIRSFSEPLLRKLFKMAKFLQNLVLLIAIKNNTKEKILIFGIRLIESRIPKKNVLNKFEFFKRICLLVG